MVSTHGDRGDAAGQPRHVHRDEAVCGGAIAQLPVLVVAPAFDATCGGHRTGVPIARRNRRDTQARQGDCHGLGAVNLTIVDASHRHGLGRVPVLGGERQRRR